MRYRLSLTCSETTQQRVLYSQKAHRCWRLDLPIAAPAPLKHVASGLKESCVHPRWAVSSAPRLTLHVAPAAESPMPTATRYAQPERTQPPVWVAEQPLLTQKNLTGLPADWDCDAALRLRFGSAATRLQSWSEQNISETAA